MLHWKTFRHAELSCSFDAIGPWAGSPFELHVELVSVATCTAFPSSVDFSATLARRLSDIRRSSLFENDCAELCYVLMNVTPDIVAFPSSRVAHVLDQARPSGWIFGLDCEMVPRAVACNLQDPITISLRTCMPGPRGRPSRLPAELL